MTADDFVASIEGFDDLTVAIQTDLLVHYLLTHGGAKAVTAGSIASLRTALRIPDHARAAQHLSDGARKRGKSKPRYVKVKDGYALERGYSTLLEQTYLGRPTARHIATSLRGTLAAISDPAVQLYLEEGVSAWIWSA